MREVGAMICVQGAVVNRRDGTCVDKGSLNEVVDKEEEKHCDGEVLKGTCFRGAVYTLNTRGRRRALQINKIKAFMYLPMDKLTKWKFISHPQDFPTFLPPNLNRSHTSPAYTSYPAIIRLRRSVDVAPGVGLSLLET